MSRSSLVIGSILIAASQHYERCPASPYSPTLDDAAFGGATPVTPKRINLTDPASRWTAATREAAFYSYSTNYLIDLDHAVIVDVEATTSVRQAEVSHAFSARRARSHLSERRLTH